MSDFRCGHVYSAALHGIDGVAVEIEVTLLSGLPSFEIVGLGDSAVRESRNRVHAALRNSGFTFPTSKVTASYAPAWLHKTGSAFDLPLALAILAASGQIDMPQKQICAIGELSLTGEIRPVPGLICRLSACREKQYKMLIVPDDNAAEAAVFSDLHIFSASHLLQITDHFKPVDMSAKKSELGKRQENQIKVSGHKNDQDNKSRSSLKPIDRTCQISFAPKSDSQSDITQIAGQQQAVRALQLAAAGRHHLLMLGSPGCGKTTLAKMLPGLLPPLKQEASLMVTRIHSAAGRLSGEGLVTRHPFRMPHHSISRAALVGGGLIPVPGEVSLAHEGVLFLDELTAFESASLDALRQPLEEQQVHIYRLHQSFVFPADFLLIAAANPCRCGEYLEPDSSCRCTSEQVARYMGRISGPMLDRFDIVIEMSRLKPYQLIQSVQGDPNNKKQGLNSDQIRKRVMQSHEVQLARNGKTETVARLNSRVSSKDLAEKLEIPAELIRYTADLANIFKLTARTYQKVLRLARTIADYDGDDRLKKDHLDEALQYRLRL